jgi:hypothetical protein
LSTSPIGEELFGAPVKPTRREIEPFEAIRPLETAMNLLLGGVHHQQGTGWSAGAHN